ncbi:MAG: DUF4835 family protein [Bacteroidota bacterium]
MMKKIILIGLLLPGFFRIYTQELNCNVQVISQQIQGTNKQVFETMQKAIYEFMNNRVWTNHVFAPEERIECNIMINFTEQISADEFKGTIQVQSRRPVYNSSYNTVLLNYMDNNFHIRYVEYEPLEFNVNTFISNLTSILSFYAYTIIGMDYDSFAPEGGEEFFNIAERIVSNAQNAPQKGWKPFDAKSNRNRYWLIKNILDDDYSEIRQFNYQYHRLGLDLMSEKPEEGRAQVAEGIELLQDIYRDKPDPFMHLLQVIIDAKSTEFVQVFSESFTEEKNRVYAMLTEIDASNSNRYEKIIKE